jgi:hypothetical protein
VKCKSAAFQRRRRELIAAKGRKVKQNRVLVDGYYVTFDKQALGISQSAANWLASPLWSLQPLSQQLTALLSELTHFKDKAFVDVLNSCSWEGPVGKKDQAYLRQRAAEEVAAAERATSIAAAKVHHELSLRYALKLILPEPPGARDEARSIGEPRRVPQRELAEPARRHSAK